MPMYLSIQLASSGAFTFLTGALNILCLDKVSTASARLASEGISITEKKNLQGNQNQCYPNHLIPDLRLNHNMLDDQCYLT